jgi:hypothetical protein
VAILLMEDTGVPGENHWLDASHWQKNVVSSTPHHEEMAFWWDRTLWGGQNIWWNKKTKNIFKLREILPFWLHHWQIVWRSTFCMSNLHIPHSCMYIAHLFIPGFTVVRFQFYSRLPSFTSISSILIPIF